MTEFGQLISIDAESNGLGGKAFAVALTLSLPGGEQDHVVYRCPILDGPTDPWVAANVIPAITDVDENCGHYREMCRGVAETFAHWGGRQVPLIAHVAWPVEARLLLDVFRDDVWAGPYPLIDVASVLLARGHDPLTVDGYLAVHGCEVPSGSPHHPLYDARAAERCYRHLMGAANV